MRQLGLAVVAMLVGSSACSSGSGSGTGSCFLGVCPDAGGGQGTSSSGGGSGSGSSSGSGSGSGSSSGGSSSGGSPGSTYVLGTINGSQVPVVDAVALSSTSYVPTGTSTAVQAVQIWITDQTATCSVLERAGNPPNASVLIVTIESNSAIGPGTYYSVATTVAGVTSATGSGYSVDDSTCASTTQTTSQSGSVTLTSVTSTAIAGTFSFIYYTGDVLQGGFNVPVCAADMNTLQAATTACGH